jgi:cell division septal protein FtsQ
MEIKTNRAPEARNSRVVPPPDIARRRKNSGGMKSKGKINGRHILSALKVLGKIGAVVMLAAFMFSILFFACTSDRFNLANISIHGCKEIDPRELEEIIRLEFSGNLLRLDLGQMKKKLQEQAWIRSVEIRRVLPSDLIVYTQERVPSVILEMRNELMVADEEGVLLGSYHPRFGRIDVPVFRGVLGTTEDGYRQNQEENVLRVRQGLRMLSEIESGEPEYARAISEVDISDRQNLKIMLVNDTAELYLGEKDYLKRLHKLMDNSGKYEELRNQYSEIEKIDLRFDRQIVYRLRQTKTDPPKNITAKLDNQR